MNTKSLYKIAIDGPSGAGKSTLAKALAARLGIVYVDTGALYRTVGLYADQNGIDPHDEAAVTAMLPNISLCLTFSEGKQHILLNGEDVGDSIRTPKASMYASAVSAIPSVRAFLLDTQRDIAKTSSVVMDGRDIGTVIFPDAEVKIFLTASPEARAKRRYEELKEKGVDVTLMSVLDDMKKRDENDRNRAIAPAVPADDAVIFDNSDMSLEDSIAEALSIIEKKLEKNTEPSSEQPKKRNAQRGTKTYRFLHALLAWIFRTLLRVRVEGLKNIPEKGGAVLCSNHIAIRDVFVIAAPLDRQPRFLSKKELFRIPILAPLIRALGATPLDRSGKDVGAIRQSIALAESGEIVTVFPQGHRYPRVNPANTPVKHGAAMIAYRAGVPMIPVCIKIKGERYVPFGKVTLVIGKPVSLEEAGLTEGGTEAYKRATEYVFAKACRLGGYEKTVDEGKKE